MDLILEEKKKQAHKIIDELKDAQFIDRLITMHELSNIKVDRNLENAISGEETIARTKERIREWWGK
jgi:hypothetical protein